MKPCDEEACAARVVLPEPESGARRIIRCRNNYRLQRRAERAFNRTLPARLNLKHVRKRAHEMKIFNRFARGKKTLDGHGIVRVSLVQLKKAVQAMLRA